MMSAQTTHLTLSIFLYVGTCVYGDVNDTCFVWIQTKGKQQQQRNGQVGTTDAGGGGGKPVQENPPKSNATTTTTTTTQENCETNGNTNNNGKNRVVTMEHSVGTFEGKSSTRRDRTSDPVMITDALSDVREK